MCVFISNAKINNIPHAYEYSRDLGIQSGVSFYRV